MQTTSGLGTKRSKWAEDATWDSKLGSDVGYIFRQLPRELQRKPIVKENWLRLLWLSGLDPYEGRIVFEFAHPILQPAVPGLPPRYARPNNRHGGRGNGTGGNDPELIKWTEVGAPRLIRSVESMIDAEGLVKGRFAPSIGYALEPYCPALVHMCSLSELKTLLQGDIDRMQFLPRELSTGYYVHLSVVGSDDKDFCFEPMFWGPIHIYLKKKLAFAVLPLKLLKRGWIGGIMPDSIPICGLHHHADGEQPRKSKGSRCVRLSCAALSC